MASAQRPITSIVRAIFEDIEELVRSEVKLAKTEVREQVASFSPLLRGYIVGFASLFFAAGFVLYAVFCGLLRWVPDWVAALLIAAVLLIGGASVWWMQSERLKSRQRALSTPRRLGGVS